MNLERWKKIEDIFQAALDLSPAERGRFIAEKSGGDEELRAEVEKLVARFEKEEEFLESPVWTDSAVLGNTLKSRVAASLEKEILPAVSEKSFSGRKIGVYLLTEQIGRGGMGVVYEAERIDGEFAQKAAVKLIKRGMDTDFIVRRFRHERQILASLNHPNIARLLDGGTSDEGSPYFVMEFIKGEPFLKYSEKKNLDLRQKLRLFLEVCAAIAYAHRQKIIHRDIKPSNILVTDEGTPKLLDFGIAKILDTESIHESLLPTATAMRLMTPEYASPEQVRGEEITPATDQYSLGVLLYELITGERPYKFPSRAPHEIARVICEEIPSEPSSGSFGKLAVGDADLRFNEDFCKNLDRIVLKTLRKNPSERYASVEEFAADIERFLRSETVRAESFAGKETAIEFPAAQDGKTSDAILSTSENSAVKATAEKQISPRRKGVKQGIFIVILTVLLIPVFLIATVAAVIPPPLITLLFLLMFFGGLIRIVYALFFESGKAVLPPKEQFTEAETKVITNPGGRETVAGNQNTAEKTVDGEESEAPKTLNITNDAIANNNLRHVVPRIIKYLLIAAAALAFGYVVYNVATHTTFTPESSSVPRDQLWKNSFASAMTVKRLTTSGTMRLPVLSPDGSAAAYVSDEAGQQSLWTRRVEADDTKQLIAPTQVFYTDLKFSPDGQFIYYIISKMPGRALYRIPASGGAAEKVSDNAFNMFAFSPDGTRIVYDYTNTDNNQRSLFIAELNEKSMIKSAETLFVLELPNFFPGGVSFSPDGKKIVYSRSRIEKNTQVVNLFVYDLETKSNEKLVARDFDDISAAVWRNNGEEIVIAASENDSAPHQIWAVGYPSGEITRLTNDFSDYTSLNLSADSAALVAERKNSVSGIWTGEISAFGRNEETKFRQITSGVDRQDGINGVNWTKDGRILYAAGIGTERNIAVMDANGANNRVIQTGATNPTLPSMTADNRYLIYADEKGHELNIWQFDMTNGALEKLNSRYAVTPALSPDDRSLVFAMLPGDDINNLNIHRKSLDDGAEKLLTKGTSVRPAVSPDNKFVAANFSGEETGNVWQIAILPLEDNGGAARFLKPYTGKFFRNPQTRPLAWSPDGRFLYFLDYKETVANIFRIPVSGNQAVTQITNFTSGEIFDFAFAPDGKRAAIARGSISSDIVMYKSSR